MNFRKTIIMVAMIIIPISTIALNNAAGTHDADDWDPIGTGIEFQQFQLSDPVPVNVFVARMDRENSNVIIESSIAQGLLSGGLETVSGMAERYNQAINFWGEPTIPVSHTWGSRNDVVVAINGYYFDYSSGIPQRGQVHSGWYAKRFDDNHNGSGFIWKMDRSAFIGGCVFHPDNKQYIYDKDSASYIFIDGINRIRNDNELILYTSQYGRDTGTDSSGIEVLVEMNTPVHTSVFGNMPYGVVQYDPKKTGKTPIPFDKIVLSAHGTRTQELETYLQKDDIIGIAQRVVDCTEEQVKNNWDLSYSGVGGHWRFLRAREIYPYIDDLQAIVREPRTAIAYNETHIFFIVADGRDPGVSEGMTVAEMAKFTKNILEATDGIMQDGGGSSTMVINGEVINNTFCNNVYCTIKVFLPLISNTSDSESVSGDQPSVRESVMQWTTEAQALQRLVANGMMMVVVDSMQKSEEYSLGNMVAIMTQTNLYLGPGTNYEILTPLSAGSSGEIINHNNGLNGVLAKGSNWWKVKVGSTEGWVSESVIEPTLKYLPSTEFKPR